MSIATIAKSEAEFSDFPTNEWHRLDNLGQRFDRALKVAHTRLVSLGPSPYTKGLIRDVVADTVIETAVGTAHVYGMNFDYEHPRYKELVKDLTNEFMKVVGNESAKDKVRAILPSGLSLRDRNARLDVFGLSSSDAVRLERMRQNGIGGQRLKDARLHMSLQRGNIVALTEVNRIINQTVETVWIDNMAVSKARKRTETGGLLLEHAGKVTSIHSIRGIPRTARKTIVTRRDNRVCDYCLPLEGIDAPIGRTFNTGYGVFPHPPFHPRCRCYMIVRY